MLKSRRALAGFGPFQYPQRRNVELSTPIVVAFPRSSRGRSAARSARRAGHVPVSLQRGSSAPLLLTTPRLRLVALINQGLVSTDDASSLLHLDLGGALVPVRPTRINRDPVSGNPTALVLSQVATEPPPQKKPAMPDPIYPLGWHHKT